MIGRWLRAMDHELEAARAAHRRAAAILLRGEFECVGGPQDGRMMKTSGFLSVYVDRGVYEHGPDHRLHYQQLAPSWWLEKAE